MNSRGKKSRVYVASEEQISSASAEVVRAENHPPSAAFDAFGSFRAQTPQSPDISTKQLLDDQLVDHDVGEEGNSSDEDTAVGSGHEYDENSTDEPRPSNRNLYRIQSQSALSSMLGHGTIAQDTRSPSNYFSNGISTPQPLTSQPSFSSSVCIDCLSSHDMPPLHYSAYSGHYECLNALLMSRNHVEVDKHERTPLFYACAANQTDCTHLIVSKREEWLERPDKQLDTPVHVSCFFGWAESLELLLQHGANSHVRNSKGFKPSHIAKTKECLELLLSYGDDLLQGDKLGRSPLFVACARNRVECVRFLCTWDYQTNSWMLEHEDNRGDRPIHAAACNGSLECLKILVEFGADIYSPNTKSMKALELAEINGHNECVEFLQKAHEDEEKTNSWYTPAHNGENEDSKVWSECYDVTSGQMYYYNRITGKCQWEKPPDMSEVNRADVMQIHGDEFLSHNTANNNAEEDDEEYVWVKKKKDKFSVVSASESQWMAIQDPHSKAIYYQNQATGAVQWEEPEAFERSQQEASAHASLRVNELWEELNQSRDSLASALEDERFRQRKAAELRILSRKKDVAQLWEKHKMKIEQQELRMLLPRSSFIRKQSMRIMKVTTSDEIDELCENDPSMEIFITTHFTNSSTFHNDSNAVGVQPKLSVCKKLAISIFQYYVSEEDPVTGVSLNKTQFRMVLKDSRILPQSPSDRTAPLKLHVADLIFAQASRVVMEEGLSPSTNKQPKPLARNNSAKSLVSGGGNSSNSVTSTDTGNVLDVSAFLSAISLVGGRILDMEGDRESETEQDEDDDDDDDEKATAERLLVDRFFLPHVMRLSHRMADHVRECNRLSTRTKESLITERLISLNRVALQSMYKHYAGIDPRFKLLTLKDLQIFAQDFKIVGTLCSLNQLFHLFQSVNWISGNSHTVVISFEKFTTLLTLIPQVFAQSFEKEVLNFSKSVLNEHFKALVEELSPSTTHSEDDIGWKFLEFLNWLDLKEGKYEMSKACPKRSGSMVKPFHLSSPPLQGLEGNKQDLNPEQQPGSYRTTEKGSSEPLVSVIEQDDEEVPKPTESHSDSPSSDPVRNSNIGKLRKSLSRRLSVGKKS